MLTETFPREIAQEIQELSPVTKAMLMYELADEVFEKLPDFPDQISATTMQHLKSLTTKQAICTIKDLAIILTQLYEKS
jgi:hypothetical protein